MILLAQGPSVTDWLSAIGQVAGAVCTFAAVVVALWIAIRDNRRLSAEARDREAMAARLVSAVLRRDVGLVFVEVRNDGVEAVHQLAVSVPSASYSITDRLVVESNGRFAESGLRVAVASPLPGHEVRRLLVEVDDDTRRAKRAEDVVVSIDFVDAAGLRWARAGMDPPVRRLDS